MTASNRSVRKIHSVIWTGMVLCVLSSTISFAQYASDPLRQGFENPPEVARPRVWWHWMDGNVSKEGIKLDLEWMQRAGLGGVQIFNASLSTPKVVDNRLAYMTPEWKDAFKYATDLADQLKLDEAIASSPGFSETGGPWVPANEAMKKYVWSQLPIKGGIHFRGTLPHPPQNTGAFQNLPVEDVGAALAGPYHGPDYYADSVVVAYRVAGTDKPLDSFHPRVTSSSQIDTTLLDDGDLTKYTSLSFPEEIGGKAWIQYEFPQPETIRSLTIVAGKKGAFDAYLPPDRPSGITLESSSDGLSFHAIVEIPGGGSTEHTLSFSPVTSKYFRITFVATAPSSIFGGAGHSKLPTSIPIAELVLHPGARVNRFEEKAAFNPLPDLYRFATPEFTRDDATPKTDVVDLTDKMKSDGTLDWTPPVGDWVILRFGYSLLGIRNHPATKEATGLEVDKLNSQYVRHYMNGYLDSYKDTVGVGMMGKRGVGFMVNDSWEAGAQNWTDNIIEEFAKRRGYDPRPWLPVLTGQVVESGQASDQFLWDFRKTIADLTADDHYGQIETSLKQRGMGHYSEAHEDGRAFIGDGMEVKKLDDVPMGAMWVQTPGVNETRFAYDADDRESASVAHIYGQNLAAAESFTTCDPSTSWAWSPETLKPTADKEFINGINRIVIHVSVHQPQIDKAPGVTFGPCGQWFNRNETWAEQAGVWVKYLARNSWLLQQGKFAADVLYFYGEDSNIAAIFHDSAPDVPVGYSFDYINADGLIHQLGVSRGSITTKSGMNYRLLVLDKYSRHMSLPVLRAIHKLVEEGAVVAGEKPFGTPSLADNPTEYDKLSDDLFGEGTGVHPLGRGKVYAGQTAAAVLKALDIAPDFDYTKPESGQPILFLHRKLTDGDLYFLNNRGDHDTTVEATFRITGKTPEFWYSDSGMISPASYKIANGRTTVPLHMDPWGTVFVVFRRPTKQRLYGIPKSVETTLTTIAGPWNVVFQSGRGAPANVTFDKLFSWTDSSNEGVKYFSGQATYSKVIEAPPEWFDKGTKLWLDLGEVKNMAVVTVNGKELSTLWHMPYRVNATSALQPGENRIEVKVINSWVNRLIGDQQPGARTKYAFATSKPYKASSPLQASGLLGPVEVVKETEK